MPVSLVKPEAAEHHLALVDAHADPELDPSDRVADFVPDFTVATETTRDAWERARQHHLSRFHTSSDIQGEA